MLGPLRLSRGWPRPSWGTPWVVPFRYLISSPCSRGHPFPEIALRDRAAILAKAVVHRVDIPSNFNRVVLCTAKRELDFTLMTGALLNIVCNCDQIIKPRRYCDAP